MGEPATGLALGTDDTTHALAARLRLAAKAFAMKGSEAVIDGRDGQGSVEQAGLVRDRSPKAAAVSAASMGHVIEPPTPGET